MGQPGLSAVSKRENALGRFQQRMDLSRAIAFPETPGRARGPGGELPSEIAAQDYPTTPTRDTSPLPVAVLLGPPPARPLQTRWSCCPTLPATVDPSQSCCPAPSAATAKPGSECPAAGAGVLEPEEGKAGSVWPRSSVPRVGGWFCVPRRCLQSTEKGFSCCMVQGVPCSPVQVARGNSAP